MILRGRPILLDDRLRNPRRQSTRTLKEPRWTRQYRGGVSEH